VATASGLSATAADPYCMEKRPWLTLHTKFHSISVSNLEGRPSDPDQSVNFTLETLNELSMRDSTWRATIKSIAWSPLTSYNGSLLAVLQSDRRVTFPLFMNPTRCLTLWKVLIYSTPSKKVADEMELLNDLTDSLMTHFSKSVEWQVSSQYVHRAARCFMSSPI